MRSSNFARGILEHDVRKYSGVGLVGQVRTEPDADIERLGELQLDWRAELMHRLAFEADPQAKRVAAFFDADALGQYVNQAIRRVTAGTATATNSILHVLHSYVLLRS